MMLRILRQMFRWDSKVPPAHTRFPVKLPKKMKTREKLTTFLEAWATSQLEIVVSEENILKIVEKMLHKKCKFIHQTVKPTIKLKWVYLHAGIRQTDKWNRHDI